MTSSRKLKPPLYDEGLINSYINIDSYTVGLLITMHESKMFI